MVSYHNVVRAYRFDGRLAHLGQSVILCLSEDAPLQL